MKVETVNVKPAFVPVTITLESVEELAFYRDVIGSTFNGVERAYGLPANTFSDAYSVLNEHCSLQRAPAYKSQGYSINFEAKKGD